LIQITQREREGLEDREVTLLTERERRIEG